MRGGNKYINFNKGLFIIIAFILVAVNASYVHAQPGILQQSDSAKSEREGLRYPISRSNYQYSSSSQSSPLYLKEPSNYESKVVYDPETNQYILSEKIGRIDYKRPSSLTFKQYREYEANKSKNEYWHAKSREESAGAGPSFMQSLRLGNQAIDRVFGTDAITITPSGSAELVFGYNISKADNPNTPIRNRRTGSFNFKEKIIINVDGSIGDKFEMRISYNTEATFDFENKTKLEYTGKEDEIIKKIEAGDVTFPLPGTLITGSQSLFGFKTELQFGKLYVTNVFSHQRSESSSINTQGGAQITKYEVDIDEYDANKHYFLGHFFKDNYNESLEDLPYIKSQVRIEQIEVWVTNKQNDFTNSRNIVALMDMGEGYGPMYTEPYDNPNFYADAGFIRPNSFEDQPINNGNNALYRKISNDLGSNREYQNIITNLTDLELSDNFINGRDYIALENARQLTEREYTVNRELGYISLNTPLRNDEVLAVAFVFTYQGQVYKVGELSNEIANPGVLILKMLKGTSPTPKYKTWELMMKNVYSIGAYQVSNEGFMLNVLYRNDRTGSPVNYLTDECAIKDEILLKVLELDTLDIRNERNPDGMFDFIEGVTINSRNGRIMFPLVEPFGRDFRDRITGRAYGNYNPAYESIADKYVFQELYDSTQTKAKQIAEKNKFTIAGQYQSSSSSEIQLNAMNIPQGSVKVTAGGITLQENSQYTVDYALGRVKILDQGLLESGTPIKVSLESHSLFNIQTKTLIGTHFDYRLSDNFNIGATLMNLTERPITSKVNLGEEPISNTIWGLNTSYRTESQLITKLVDKIPLINTKEKSSFAIDAEFAHLIPGQSKLLTEHGGGTFIDDFEGTQSKIDMRNYTSWVLASAPRGLNQFPEHNLNNDLSYGFNRAEFSWYRIDPIFNSTTNNQTPDNITDDEKNSHFAREIFETEIFQNKDPISGYDARVSALNIAYYPQQRGPYNYTVENLNDDGTFANPEDKWGGIMREILTSDFETSNVEYIEFWLMDPFVEDYENYAGGDLYFNLGEISEDILRDSRKTFEHGLPVDATSIAVDTTVWGRVPTQPPLIAQFDQDEKNREYQDVGLDGLSTADEQTFFADFLDLMESQFGSGSPVLDEIRNDPSSDDFLYYLGDHYDNLPTTTVAGRYKHYNGLDGNSPVTGNNDFSTAGKSVPDIEDINDDNTLNQTETYYQYRVSIRPEDLRVGRNYITDKVTSEVTNNDGDPIDWFQFRIPLADWNDRIGEIEDFKSIRFMRMYLSNFSDSVILRFGTLELVRGEWRQYKGTMSEGGPMLTQESLDGVLEVSAVNIEENASKTPIPYVLPPGVTQIPDPSQPTYRGLNEQSLLLKVKDLRDEDAKAVFKNVSLDLRQYKKLTMFVHAEALTQNETEFDSLLGNNELTAFIRIGSDYQENYYEYEVPLQVTSPGAGTPDSIWPTSNNFEINLEDFVDLKLERNRAISKNPTFYSFTKIYRTFDGNTNKMLKIKGNPNLSNIRQIMLGIRNPGDGTSVVVNDGFPKSAEIWFNELKMSEFKNKGGWAANSRIQIKLADFGMLSIAGSTSSPGFGSIDQSVEERSKEQINQYDVSTNLELGKFFPEKANVSIPMFMGVSETKINPQYYPKDPDVELKEILKNAESSEERKMIKTISQDYSERRSINFTNVKWNKQFKGLMPFSPGNFMFSVNYNQLYSRNYNIEYNRTLKYGTGMDYILNTRAKNIQPFRKSKALKSDYLRLIKDFNVNPYPSRFTFSTDLDRNYNESKMRDVFFDEDADILIRPSINKDFSWRRRYTFKWDFTRALKFDYNAENIARIDEPAGAYDLFKENNRRWKKEVWENMLTGGRNTNFNQNFSISYTIPVNKIPLLNWVNSTARYNANYSWIIGPQLEEYNLGNNIKNSNTIQLTNQLNMTSLYNKVGFLKKIKGTDVRSENKEKRYKEVNYSQRVFLRKSVPKNILHRLGTQDITVNVYDADGTIIESKVEIVNENKIKITVDDDYVGANVNIDGRIEKGDNPLKILAESTGKIILGIQSISLSYSNTSGLFVPGYLYQTDYLGIDKSIFYMGSPIIPFTLGIADTSFPRRIAERNWLTEEETFSEPYIFNSSENVNFRTTFQPFRGFRVDITATRTYSEQISEYVLYNPTDSVNRRYGDYTASNRMKGGSFSISFISIGTAFEKMPREAPWESKAFNKLKENRAIISRRLFVERTENLYEGGSYILTESSYPGHFNGYGSTSADVLIPAFISAYGNRDPEKVSIDENPFPWWFMPNWKVNFDGLSRVDFFTQYTQSINISHSYQSTYNIGSFVTNLDYTEDTDIGGVDDIRDMQNNIIPKYLINSVSINEKISPLFGIDITWQNNLLTRFELNKTRTLALSLVSNQLTETRNNDIVVGVGYVFKQLPITINERAYKSDLNLRFDFAIRDNITIIRYMAELEKDQVEVPTTGQKIFKINFTADYALTTNLNLQFFFDREIKNPYTSRQYLTAETNIGFSLSFELR